MSTDKKKCPIDDDCTWEQWSQHILKNLERLTENQEKMMSKLGDCSEEIARLKVRSSVWGGITGGLSAVLIAVGVLLWEWIKKGTR